MITCPRCTSRLIRSHDELTCLVHGEVYAPIRAIERRPSFATGRRRHDPEIPLLPWTDQERALWAADADVPQPAAQDDIDDEDEDVAGDVPQTPLPSTSAEALAWVADRVDRGLLVGASVLMTELRIPASTAAAIMGGPWPLLTGGRR